MFELSPSDKAAWYGAALASVIFCWEIYKHLTNRAKVRVTNVPNTRLITKGVAGIEKSEPYISFRVANIGTITTTITNLGAVYYKNWFMKLLNRPHNNEAFAVPHALNTGGRDMPYVLEVGTEWSGGMEQTAEIVEMSKNGWLMGQVFCSHRVKPIITQIKIKEKN
ncbi:hypothetical protein N8742_02890 [Emcibacteraceae bacterium]|nr:hypothetical protein [Emcibacteraceae bacterium]